MAGGPPSSTRSIRLCWRLNRERGAASRPSPVGPLTEPKKLTKPRFQDRDNWILSVMSVLSGVPHIAFVIACLVVDL